MSIETELYLLNGGVTLLTLFAVYQAVRLHTLYGSGSSWMGGLAFLVMGGRQVYVLWRLRSAIVEAKMKGYMIDHLSTEQWLVGVLWPYAIIICFVVWLHWKRNDLKKLGV